MERPGQPGEAGSPGAGDGGGLSIAPDSSFTLVGVVMSGNQAQRSGGGVFAGAGSGSVMINAALSGNQAEADGGGIYYQAATPPQFSNLIVWGNTSPDANPYLRRQVSPEPPDDAFASSCIEGQPGPAVGRDGLDKNGNLVDCDSQFIHAVGSDGVPGTADDDLRVKCTSPVIDAGDNGVVPPDTWDLDGDGNREEPLPYARAGKPRIYGDEVDMGAYEFQAEPCPRE